MGKLAHSANPLTYACREYMYMHTHQNLAEGERVSAPESGKIDSRWNGGVGERGRWNPASKDMAYAREKLGLVVEGGLGRLNLPFFLIFIIIFWG